MGTVPNPSIDRSAFEGKLVANTAQEFRYPRRNRVPVSRKSHKTALCPRDALQAEDQPGTIPSVDTRASIRINPEA
jgi:hypothetical protein